MGNFAWIRDGNVWDFKSPLLSTEMQQLDAMRPKLINAAEGSVHTPSAPIIIGGSGMQLTGPVPAPQRRTAQAAPPRSVKASAKPPPPRSTGAPS